MLGSPCGRSRRMYDAAPGWFELPADCNWAACEPSGPAPGTSNAPSLDQPERSPSKPSANGISSSGFGDAVGEPRSGVATGVGDSVASGVGDSTGDASGTGVLDGSGVTSLAATSLDQTTSCG